MRHRGTRVKTDALRILIKAASFTAERSIACALTDANRRNTGSVSGACLFPDGLRDNLPRRHRSFVQADLQLVEFYTRLLQTISDLASRCDHLPTPEKTRLASLVIERVDHDPADSTFSITLTPTGLQTLGTGPARQATTA